ncbi:MAG: hypothetical protein ACYTF7_09310, partial [Planctomycetota bacterium]
MFKLAAGSAIVAALLGATGYLQNQTLSMFKDTPSTLSAQDLAADSPGENRHITLTDFVIPDDHIVELNDWNQPRRAWIKAVPVGSEAHQALQEAEHIG